MNHLEPNHLLDLLQVIEEDRVELLNNNKPKTQLELAFKYIHGLSFRDNPVPELTSGVDSSQPIRKSLKILNFATIARAMPNFGEPSSMEKELKAIQDSMALATIYARLNKALAYKDSSYQGTALTLLNKEISEILIKRKRYDLIPCLSSYANPTIQVLMLLTTTALDNYIRIDVTHEELELLANILIKCNPIDEIKLGTTYVWAFLKLLKGEHLLCKTPNPNII